MKRKYFTCILLIVLAAIPAVAEQRFPPPDFESGYTQPVVTFQEYYTGIRQYVDVAVLAAALILGIWLTHTRRSRKGIFLLGIFCLIYFGFYKEGCVCPIGSIQNITLAVADSSYPVSIPVMAVFFLPLVIALLYGRIYCGGVCLLGAIQDLFLFRAVRVPRWIEGPLGLLRFFYLGLAVYFVIVYSRFVICEYDPFVSFFRLSGPFWRMVMGAVFLLTALFVARPYCRYLCPYGAILSLLSRWTKVKVRITPDKCTNCTLCDATCPFEAIDRPVETSAVTPGQQRILLLLTFILAGLFTAAGYFLLGRTTAGLLLGLWFGIVTGFKLIGQIYQGKRQTYEVNQAECLACARCYQWCPYDEERMKAEEQELEAGQ